MRHKTFAHDAVGDQDMARQIDLQERLRIFGFTGEDLQIAAKMWAILEPEIHFVSEIQIEQWVRLFPARSSADLDMDAALASRNSELRDRYLRLGESSWVQAANRIVARAYSARLSLSAILSIDSAGAIKTLEILSRRYDCSKEERLRLNDVFFRMRSLECDIYSSLFTAYMGHEAHLQREHLSEDFQKGIGLTVEAATREGAELRRQAGASANSARGVLERVSEVAAAAEQSASAMRDAAEGAAGLIRVIDGVREEAQVSAEIAVKAAAQKPPASTVWAGNDGKKATLIAFLPNSLTVPAGTVVDSSTVAVAWRNDSSPNRPHRVPAYRSRRNWRHRWRPRATRSWPPGLTRHAGGCGR